MARDMENAKRLKKEWYERNKELTKQRARNRDLANPEQAAARKAKWREENREKHNETNRKWFAKNKDKRAAHQAKRRALQIQRTPSWDPDAHLIPAKYQLAAMLSRETGEPWHVDHHFPLNGKLVSGLHVFSNLVVKTQEANLKKSNKMPD